MRGVQGHADSSGYPLAPAHLRGAGVRPRGARHPLLAPGLHAALLRVARVRGGVRVGLQARPLSGGQYAVASFSASPWWLVSEMSHRLCTPAPCGVLCLY